MLQESGVEEHGQCRKQNYYQLICPNMSKASKKTRSVLSSQQMSFDLLAPKQTESRRKIVACLVALAVRHSQARGAIPTSQGNVGRPGQRASSLCRDTAEPELPETRLLTRDRGSCPACSRLNEPELQKPVRREQALERGAAIGGVCSSAISLHDKVS
jgi:hypothetical protein